MRRLPVYLLLDTSGSMFGEPIESLNNALSGMFNTLRTDAQALESLFISIITFDKEIQEIVPLTELVNFQLPEIRCPQSGPTFTGKALEFLELKVQAEIQKSTEDKKGDWKPLLFIFTDGKPSDLQLYNDMIPKIKAINFGTIVGCAAGHKAEISFLKQITEHVVHLNNTDSQTLKSFFKWVSETIEQGNKSVDSTDDILLPPPPSEVNLVI